MVWRVGSLVFLLAALTALVLGGGWWWLLVALAAFAVADAFRSVLRVADGRITMRGIARWRRPIVLAELDLVRIKRVGLVRTPFLHVRDRQGATEVISLRRWERHDELLERIARAATRPPASASGRRAWRLDLDDRTREVLDGLVDWHAFD